MKNIIKPIIALSIIMLTYSYFFMILLIEQKANLIILTAIVGFTSTCVGYYLGASTSVKPLDLPPLEVKPIEVKPIEVKSIEEETDNLNNN